MIKLPKFEDYTDQPVKYIQRKMDGHMYHITVDEGGRIKCITKNGKDKTDKILAVNRIRESLKRLPTYTHLMVELHCPGEQATTVASMIAHSDQRLEIAVFACPLLGGWDFSKIALDKIMADVSSYGLDVVPVEVLPHTGKLHTESLLKNAIEQGIEGWVLKESHMEGWYKLKPVKTIDAFVTDVTESDSETYAGHMKAVSLGLCTRLKMIDESPVVHDLGECGGGFTKEFKLSMTYEQAKNKLVGQVCEVAYQSVTTHKKLQFPRFIRWRDDKDASQCTTEQLV